MPGKILCLVIAALGVSACQPVAPLDAPPAEAAIQDHASPVDPLAFAQAACGGCHAVESERLSPNPAAPPFTDIANRKGLSQASLTAWLYDAHNYPEMMDFDLDRDQAEQLAAHMLTLKQAKYEKPIF